MSNMSHQALGEQRIVEFGRELADVTFHIFEVLLNSGDDYVMREIVLVGMP